MPLISMLLQRKPRWRSLTRGGNSHFSYHLLRYHLRATVVKGRGLLSILQRSSLLERGCLLAPSRCLTYNDMLETARNEAKRRELRDKLACSQRELAAGAGHEKQLAAEVQESHVLRKALELEVNGSTAKINELQADLKRARGELDHSRELIEKQND
ncbi:hypothetical protein ACOSQ2_028498 [Xanthoceras sorbifolium]